MERMWPRFFRILRSHQRTRTWRQSGSARLAPLLRTFGSFPSTSEQVAIADYVGAQMVVLDDDRCAQRDRPQSSAEYRTRLIADVVTGKLDVREAARLPDEMPMSWSRSTTAEALSRTTTADVDEALKPVEV